MGATRYRALIALDWGKPHRRKYQQKLVSALIDAHWNLVETSTFAIDTPDLKDVWKGLDLVARASTVAGTLTALSVNIVGSDDFSKSKPYAAKKNHPNALDDFAKIPYPS